MIKPCWYSHERDILETSYMMRNGKVSYPICIVASVSDGLLYWRQMLFPLYHNVDPKWVKNMKTGFYSFIEGVKNFDLLNINSHYYTYADNTGFKKILLFNENEHDLITDVTLLIMQN